MHNAKLVALILAVSIVVAAGAVSAQTPAPAAPPPYGPAISLEQAKKAMAGAEAEARKNALLTR